MNNWQRTTAVSPWVKVKGKPIPPQFQRSGDCPERDSSAKWCEGRSTMGAPIPIMSNLESDPSFLWWRVGIQQLFDQINHLDNLFIMVGQSSFNLGYFPLQLLLAGNELSQFDKGTDDKDADFDGSRCVQHAGGHDGAVLCKSIR